VDGGGTVSSDLSLWWRASGRHIGAYQWLLGPPHRVPARQDKKSDGIRTMPKVKKRKVVAPLDGEKWTQGYI